MKIAVIGANGQLGTDLCRIIPQKDLIPLNQDEIEITDIGSVKSVILKYKPEVIINTAAYVRVDDCETNIDTAFRVNALGARNLAVISQETGAKLVQLGTDYVFGGDSRRNTPYTEFDSPAPINIYGKSKLAGENLVRHLCHKHIIIRTSGLFGIAGSEGKGGNFVESILKLAHERKELKVVNDQIFSPTYTKDLALKILELTTTEYYGIFHVTNSGICSWYDFAKEIIGLTNLTTNVIPVTSEQYPQKAQRPKYSVLDNYQLKLLGINDIRDWTEALRDYFKK